ncbi:DUF3466 family protein [Vibrio sp. TH_r3]|uniref:DUF3466 family protein n=1 Tax=Vibrio sp. TH_r3 TaxID=3082084 RepID=UPI0029556432|nr:DUF3466 family protein [Vibrio sp. TH_r3]MDV7103409.1 DUF3466 family protein [Vibrio sp. TH_r3]
MDKMTHRTKQRTNKFNFKIPFSLSVSALMFALPAHSALYQVVKVTSPTDSVESYGIAIEPSDDSSNCFSDQCSDDSYSFAGETFNGTEGFSYKDEVPFGIDNGFYYLDYDDLEDYCDDELGYSTCEYWAYKHWYGNTDLDIGGLQNEREAYYTTDYQTNNTAFYDSDTLTFVPDTGDNAPSESDYYYSFVEDTDDKVVTRLVELNNTDYVIGNTSSGYYAYDNAYIKLYRNRGYYATSTTQEVLEPEADTSIDYGSSDEEQNIIAQMGQTMAFDSFTYDNQSYVVGSASVATFYYDEDDDDKDYDSDYTDDTDEESVYNCLSYDEPAFYPECQNFGFATRAFIWNVSTGIDPNQDSNRFAVADWETDSDDDNYVVDDNYASPQGSVHAATIASSGSYADLPVLVGYNTELDDDYDVFFMQAAIFLPTNTTDFSVDENAWSTTFIEDVTAEVDDSYIHSNSVATDINENLLVIGYAKRDGDYPSGNSAGRRMFITDANDSEPTASFFTSHGESIFFSSAGGTPRAINNFNEIVGQVDAESSSEVGGKERDHRGFIYPYYDTGTDTTRLERFASQAWWLDDLTNGGTYSSSNNHFRIIDASDINDAGVISATASQCFASDESTSSIEYDSTDHWAYCNEGDGDERVTAVKLVPISGATSDDISEREEDTTTVSRSGGSINWLWLISLCLITSHRYSFSRKEVI